MSTISVIVPVYKVEQYLNRCVDSILSQSYLDFQLILVDDGSPDNCGGICDEYARKDRRVHVIHQENGGLSAARNAAIDWMFTNSDSQWMTFVDSDDWIHPQMLETLFSLVRQHDVKISVCSYSQTNGEEPQLYGDCPKGLWKPEAFYTERNVNAVIACGKLYHRDCFANIRYPVGKVHEDEFVTYRILFSQREIAVTEQPLYFYFYNPEGITKTGWSRKRLDGIEAIGNQVEYFRRNGYPCAYKVTAVDYVSKLFQNRRQLWQSALPEAEKKRCDRYLRRCLLRAVWRYRDVYLAEERGVYLETFPGLTKVYRTVKRIIKR